MNVIIRDVGFQWCFAQIAWWCVPGSSCCHRRRRGDCWTRWHCPWSTTAEILCRVRLIRRWSCGSDSTGFWSPSRAVSSLSHSPTCALPLRMRSSPVLRTFYPAGFRFSNPWTTASPNPIPCKIHNTHYFNLYITQEAFGLNDESRI